MFIYYCREPECPGHIRSWERCSDVRAFHKGDEVLARALPGKTCSGSPLPFRFPALLADPTGPERAQRSIEVDLL